MKNSIFKQRIQRTLFAIVFLSIIGIYNPSFSQSWTQLGVDIDGEAANDFSGEFISLSADGLSVAIGARTNMGNNGFFDGHTRVYKLISGNWIQQGEDINGEGFGDNSGSSVSISADGSIVAIGAYFNSGNGIQSGHVRVFKFNGEAWIQQGIDIDGETAGDLLGWSVGLSADGLTVAVGAINNNGNSTVAGHVKIYGFNGGTWEQQGTAINGETLLDQSGWSVSLSADGLAVAIGAPYNDENGTNTGHVRIFKFDGAEWVQQGVDIDGESVDDQSGWDVSLNDDGTIVAIGSPFNVGGGIDRGYVRVFELISNTWTQRGNSILGEGNVDASGQSISISDNGNIVAIGAPLNDGSAAEAGHVRVYEYNGGNWTQLGIDIDGEAADDQSGWSVSLSSDGTRLAIGARNNDGTGSNAGHVRVFSFGTGTGLVENSFFESVSVFPNPNDGLVNIDLGDMKNVSIQLFNVNGQLIYRKTNINSEIYQFEINDVSGVYFIELSASGEKQRYKVVKR